MNDKTSHHKNWPLYYFLLCSLFIFTACSSKTIKVSAPLGNSFSSRHFIPLAGIWKFKQGDLQAANFYSAEISDHLWKNIKVPANWYLEGFDINGVAWYRKHFKISDQFAEKRITLKFGGVDYTADVWLNGQYIGFHEGYFQPFSFDVTEAIHFDKENLLAVKVNSPLEHHAEDWSLHKRQVKGIFGHHDTRPGGAWRIAQPPAPMRTAKSAILPRVSHWPPPDALRIDITV